MTLNSIMGIFCVISQNSVAFGSGGAHCAKVVEDTPILSAAEMSQKNPVFSDILWRYWQGITPPATALKWDTFLSLRTNIGSKSVISLQRGPVDPKFQVAPLTNHSSRKTRLNDLSYGITIWTDLSSVLSQSTRLTDRQTDRQTDDGQTDRQNSYR